jgi:hypothetical protein
MINYVNYWRPHGPLTREMVLGRVIPTTEDTDRGSAPVAVEPEVTAGGDRATRTNDPMPLPPTGVQRWSGSRPAGARCARPQGVKE